MAFGDTATLVSNFDGADENPLSDGGNFAKLDTSGAADIQRSSNQFAGVNTSTGGRYWTPANFGPDLEIYCTVTVKPNNTRNIGIAARIQQAGGSATWDGYNLAFAAASGTDTWNIERFTNGAPTSLLSGSREFAAGEKMGMSIIGSVITAYVFTGGSWTQLGQTSDGTYSAAGAIAVRGSDVTFRGDDLFAGTISGQVGQSVTNVLGRGNAW